MANTTTRYQQYVKQAQDYTRAAQAKDPAFQAWQAEADKYTADMGGAPAWNGTDYTSEWFKTLTPEQQADYEVAYQDVDAQNKKSLKGRIGSTLKFAVPALVGGAALAGTGLFGAGAQGFVGGAPLGSSGAVAGGIDAATAAGALGGAGDASIGAGGLLGGGAEAGLGYGGYGGAGGTIASQGGLLGGTSIASGASPLGSLGVDAAGMLGGAASGGGALSSLGSAGSSLAGWIAKNPGLASSLLGGAVAAAGGSKPGSSTGGGTFAPQPGIRMGTLLQPQQQQGGLLSGGMQSPMYANSGLARFGATGGNYTPGYGAPGVFRWGQA